MAPYTREERAEIIKILCLCVVWYSMSSASNVIGKMLLTHFPYPMSVTMVQLLSITFYMGPVLRCLGIRRQTDISWGYYKKIVLPLALGKFIASVFSHISIWKVPISYAHTVKATMPFFTVLLTRICFGEKHTFKIYLSLAPIILGVAIATITELSFDMIGLCSALSATCGFSLQNIFSKKVLNDTGIHPLRLLHLLGRLALLMFLPVWLLGDVYTMVHDPLLSVRRSGQETIILLVVDGALSWLQNLVAFTILHKVAPLTYAVANASKRVVIVSISLLVLANPVTPFNILGMMLSILGVLAYNKAKYDANVVMKRSSAASLLPVTASPYLHQLHPPYPYNYTPSSTLYPATTISSSNGRLGHHQQHLTATDVSSSNKGSILKSSGRSHVSRNSFSEEFNPRLGVHLGRNSIDRGTGGGGINNLLYATANGQANTVSGKDTANTVYH